MSSFRSILFLQQCSPHRRAAAVLVDLANRFDQVAQHLRELDVSTASPCAVVRALAAPAALDDRQLRADIGVTLKAHFKTPPRNFAALEGPELSFVYSLHGVLFDPVNQRYVSRDKSAARSIAHQGLAMANDDNTVVLDAVFDGRVVQLGELVRAPLAAGAEAQRYGLERFAAHQRGCAKRQLMYALKKACDGKAALLDRAARFDWQLRARTTDADGVSRVAESSAEMARAVKAELAAARRAEKEAEREKGKRKERRKRDLTARVTKPPEQKSSTKAATTRRRSSRAASVAASVALGGGAASSSASTAQRPSTATRKRKGDSDADSDVGRACLAPIDAACRALDATAPTASDLVDAASTRVVRWHRDPLFQTGFSAALADNVAHARNFLTDEELAPLYDWWRVGETRVVQAGESVGYGNGGFAEIAMESAVYAVMSLVRQLEAPPPPPPPPTGATFTVAVAQMDVVLGDVERNVAHMTALLDTAAARGARLCVFPECALAGYCAASCSFQHTHALAEPVPGRGSRALAAACERLDI